MAHRDDATLLDIAIALRRILSFLDGVDEAAFRGDELRKSAVIHQLLVAGEAVKRVSIQSRDAHPQIPWGDIARMRDRLIHSYDMVDLDIVCETAFRQVPGVLRQLEPLLPKKDQ